MKPIQLLFLSVLLSGCNNPSPTTSTSKLDTSTGLYRVTSDNTSMNLAIARAKISIDQFDKAFEKKDSAYSDFAVKKKYDTEDGGEHMWIAVTKIVDGNYQGYVSNDAEETREVKYGDSVVVLKDEITDWMYLDNNVLKGGYTIREIRNRLSKEEQLQLDKELGFKIED